MLFRSETLEETIAFSISINALNKLYTQHIDIANWMRVLQQENFLWLQEMHINRLVLPVKDRYVRLVSKFPKLLQRVNLGYIASYLGTTLPTLSKIRSEVCAQISSNDLSADATPSLSIRSVT